MALLSLCIFNPDPGAPTKNCTGLGELTLAQWAGQECPTSGSLLSLLPGGLGLPSLGHPGPPLPHLFNEGLSFVRVSPAQTLEDFT